MNVSVRAEDFQRSR